MNFASDVSRQVINIVKLLPKPLDLLAFRGYRKLLRFWPWQAYTARAYFGSLFVCDINDLIQSSIFYFGFWEPMVSQVTAQLLHDGDVYVDVGANIGYYSLLASSCVGGSGKVISIEASPRIYSLLAENAARNSVSNIRMINMAASDRRETLAIYAADGDNIGRTTTIEARGLGIQKECSINALPIDEILSVNELNRVRLIKIDVEGAELPILIRLVDTLAKYPDNISIIVEASVQDEPGGWARVFMRLLEAGFVAYEIENRYDIEWYFRYVNQSSVKLMKHLPNRQVDILFIRTALPTTLKG